MALDRLPWTRGEKGGGQQWARSVSAPVLPLLQGPVRPGVALGAGHLDLGDYVLTLTRPGAPRMPNGVECELVLTPGQLCWVGGGRLLAGDEAVLPGSPWDPVPRPRPPGAGGWPWAGSTGAKGFPDVEELAGRGEGLTPAGDDYLVGYAAALALLKGRRAEARALAEAAAARTTRLSATLLRHAARGELPEPAHALLERWDPGPLLGFGHSSGRWIFKGLAAGAAAP